MNTTISVKKAGTSALPEGKTRNAVATRNAILEAARKYFLKDGYDNAGVRTIAADAGIDAALISRYFGSKRQLFAEVLENTQDESISAFVGERGTCGRRLAEAMLHPTRKTANCMNFISLVTSSGSSPEAGKLLHEHIEQRFMLPLAEWLGGPRAQQNAWLIGSMLMGAAIMHNIKPEQDNNIEHLAAILQGIIDSSNAALPAKKRARPARA